MRARHWLTLASVGSLVVLGLAAGCGDTDEATPARADGGGDAVSDTAAATDGKKEAAPVECVDADITTLSSIPDAALGDAGKSIGTCASCIKSNCTAELDACQDDCDCRDSVLSFFTCVGSGKSITACGAGLVSAGSAATALGGCALQSGCAAECGQGGPTGTDAASDAPADAPADGG